MGDVLLIDADAIPGHLTGEAEVGGGDVVVRCGEVDVCRYADGELVALACDHPRHGCRPDLREKYERVHELMAKLRGAGAYDGPCPKCEGAGWLAVNSPEARHTVILSLMMGMWRGLAFTPRGLNAGDLGDTLGAFLPGLGPGGASSSPAGVAAPGRTLFHPEQSEGEEEGKGEG